MRHRLVTMACGISAGEYGRDDHGSTGDRRSAFRGAGRHRARHVQSSAGAQRLHLRDVRASRADLRRKPTRIARSRCWFCAAPATRPSRRAPTSTSFAHSRRRRTPSTTKSRIDRVLTALEKCRVPTIAAITGACTGGGAGIAACCDLRIGTRTTKIGFPIARTLGNCLSMSNISRLTALIGPARVKDIIFTARLIEARGGGAPGTAQRSRRRRAPRCRRAPTNSPGRSPAMRR